MYGAGGHARVVIATLEAAGVPVAGCFDDAHEGGLLDGVPVLGPIAPHLPLGGPLVLAVGSNAARRALAERLGGLVTWARAVHPSAVVHRSAVVGAGAVVFAGAVVQPGVRIGQHVIVNTAATVDHDSVLEDFVHVGPGTHLAGSVFLEAGVLFGVGACAAPGVRVGEGTVVGAGAVVTRNLPANVVAVGMPAKPIKETPEAW